jgi:hypothetical protein
MSVFAGMSNNFKVHKLKQEESKDFQSITSLQIQGYSRPSIFVFKFKAFQVLYTNPACNTDATAWNPYYSVFI